MRGTTSSLSLNGFLRGFLLCGIFCIGVVSSQGECLGQLQACVNTYVMLLNQSSFENICGENNGLKTCRTNLEAPACMDVPLAMTLLEFVDSACTSGELGSYLNCTKRRSCNLPNAEDPMFCKKRQETVDCIQRECGDKAAQYDANQAKVVSTKECNFMVKPSEPSTAGKPVVAHVVVLLPIFFRWI